MQRKAVAQLTIGTACAIALFAADAWKTKDSTQWTSEEVTKVLTDSPWAKDKTVAPEGAGQPQRGNRRGGMGQGGGIGFPGGGYPRGGGYPGGGGGYPGGGGGYPPGGGGYPNGGNYPNGGGQGRYPDDDSRPGGSMRPINITVRWQSALPVQQALQRQGSLSAEESKALADASQKDYIITIVGLRMPGRRSRSSSTDSTDSSDQDRGRDSKASTDELRSRYLDAARLVPHGKSPIYAEDIQFEGPNGATEMRFLFPRAKAISADDKEVVFDFELQGVKFEHKFRLSDMNYQGKLAL